MFVRNLVHWPSVDIDEKFHIYSYCYYGNGERWQRNKYNSDFEAWTQKTK